MSDPSQDGASLRVLWLLVSLDRSGEMASDCHVFLTPSKYRA